MVISLTGACNNLFMDEIAFPTIIVLTLQLMMFVYKCLFTITCTVSSCSSV